MRLKDFFYFGKMDRSVALLLLAFVVGGAVFLGKFGYSKSAKPSASAKGSSLYGDNRRGGGQGGAYGDNDARDGKAERFLFDPNTADSTQLLRLGLAPWQVRAIYHYRAKGGTYQRPLDFARLPGLTQKLYRELEPYIRIGRDYAPAAELYTPERSRFHFVDELDTMQRHRYDKLSPTERLNLNTADTAMLKRVPGIGPYFAKRVTRYREWLGGFYSVDQLYEIDQFPKEATGYFYVKGNTRKLKINEATLNELKRHPYINYYQAKAILEYRRLRGRLKDLDDLRLLNDFSPEDIERLSHYVQF